MDLLAERITQSINEIGLQIDVLYKLSQKDRQQFLNKIQLFKSTLLQLKANLRNNNKEYIQSRYKNTRIEIIQMKKLIQALLQEEKTNILNKQNKRIYQNRFNSTSKQVFKDDSLKKSNLNFFQQSSISIPKIPSKRIQSGVMKHINKKQYEDLMKNIAQQSQINSQMSQQLEKFKIQNQTLSETLKKTQEKSENLILQVKTLEVDIKELQYKNFQLKKDLSNKANQIQNVKQSEHRFRSKLDETVIEISQLKNQLSRIQQKMLNYENLGETTYCKIQILERNLKKYQDEISLLKKSIQRSESDLQRKILDYQEVKFICQQENSEKISLESQLRNKSQDLQILQKQLMKTQKNFYQIKIDKQNLQTNLVLEKQTIVKMYEQATKQIQSLKTILYQKTETISLQQKDYINLRNKICELEKRSHHQEEDYQRLQQIYINSQNQFQQEKRLYVCDLELKQIQISKLSQQVRKSLELTRKLQEQIQNTHKNHSKLKDDRKYLSIDLKQYQIKNIHLSENFQEVKKLYHQASNNLQIKNQQLQNQILKNKNLQNQLKQIRIRLHRAKIQAIHDIRNNLF